MSSTYWKNLMVKRADNSIELNKMLNHMKIVTGKGASEFDMMHGEDSELNHFLITLDTLTDEELLKFVNLEDYKVIEINKSFSIEDYSVESIKDKKNYVVKNNNGFAYQIAVKVEREKVTLSYLDNNNVSVGEIEAQTGEHFDLIPLVKENTKKVIENCDISVLKNEKLFKVDTNLFLANNTKPLSIKEINLTLYNDESIIMKDFENNRLLSIEKNYDGELMYRIYDENVDYDSELDIVKNPDVALQYGVIEVVEKENEEYDLPEDAIHQIISKVKESSTPSPTIDECLQQIEKEEAAKQKTKSPSL